MDDQRLAAFGQFTPEGTLTPGYGDSYLFCAGRDDVHGILLALLTAETMALKLNMFGYDDQELNDAILALMANRASPSRAARTGPRRGRAPASGSTRRRSPRPAGKRRTTPSSSPPTRCSWPGSVPGLTPSTSTGSATRPPA